MYIIIFIIISLIYSHVTRSIMDNEEDNDRTTNHCKVPTDGQFL